MKIWPLERNELHKGQRHAFAHNISQWFGGALLQFALILRYACRALFGNMVEGLSTGFTKTLTMIGVGYRGLVDGKTLTLNLGYSNPVLLPIPEGIEVQVQSREH